MPAPGHFDGEMRRNRVFERSGRRFAARRNRWTSRCVVESTANQEIFMSADSDSTIAWHRAQLKQLRETLKNIETARFTVGEPAQSRKTGKTQTTIAELQRKISQSLQIISAHERQTRRPRTTDQQTLASVSWSSWNAQAAHTRGNNSR
jgi:hypothetical protein